MTQDDRPRGILSPADRAFLRGDVTHESEQSRYDARYRIRERVRNAVLDFSILFEQLEPRDREQIFAPDDDSAPFVDGVVDALAFLYLGADDGDRNCSALVAESIRRAERRRRADGFVSVQVDVERASPEHVERILDRVEAGAYHELGEDDLRVLASLLHERSGADEDVLDKLRESLDGE